MQYVVAICSVCAMRSDASHKSEIVSQLLLGEAGEVLGTKGDFVHIRCLYDGYEGWCAKSQLAGIDSIEAFTPSGYIAKPNNVGLLNGTNIQLSIASPVFAKAAAGNYTIEFEEGISVITGPENDDNIAFIKQLTYQYLNTPYLWGGKSSFGIDCSGFTQQVFKLLGIKLLRDAYQQATQGMAIPGLRDVICGDLAFFDNADGRITHVGILLDDKTIIHASGYVRIDPIDGAGITHSVTGERTHKLAVIKRVTA